MTEPRQMTRAGYDGGARLDGLAGVAARESMDPASPGLCGAPHEFWGVTCNLPPHGRDVLHQARSEHRTHLWHWGP